MKVKVIERFNDLLCIKLRDVGEIYECSPSRASELIEKGLVEKYEEPKVEVKEVKEPKEFKVISKKVKKIK